MLTEDEEKKKKKRSNIGLEKYAHAWLLCQENVVIEELCALLRYQMQWRGSASRIRL